MKIGLTEIANLLYHAKFAKTFLKNLSRSVWYYPLRLDAPLYIEVVFNQIAPDYLEGLLLVISGEHLPQEIIVSIPRDICLRERERESFTKVKND